ncbi:MAG: signal recognition particle-docking protein FtsY [SAR324 cluster bacterium]|nr:signal recognition particle-docking protein FtsY [SAR324 cluster bacterium]
MDLTFITQFLNEDLGIDIVQFLNKDLGTDLTEEAILYILGGGVFFFLLSIFFLIALYRLLAKKGDGEEISEKGTDKQLAKLEKAHLKRQKQEEKEQKALQEKKNEARLSQIAEEERLIQEKLTKIEEERRQTKVLQSDLIPDQEETPAEPASFMERLKQGMAKTRSNLIEGIGGIVLGKKEIDEDTLDDLEELLYTADIGPETTNRIIEVLHHKLARNELNDPKTLRITVQEEIIKIMEKSYPSATVDHTKPLVLLFIGVNGVGKTTTIGKIAAQYQQAGKRVLMGAGDTFRAAAIEQLEEWSKRANSDFVSKKAGSDPSSVMYETVSKAIQENYDVVICDTAGRLHTKANLMEELKKMIRVIKKVIPDAPHEIFLVLDATTGQNAIFQVREFREIAEITGLIITKLDGTAKGGVVIGIVNEFDIPVRYIGVGESIQDLQPFNASEFTESLFT